MPSRSFSIYNGKIKNSALKTGLHGCVDWSYTAIFTWREYMYFRLSKIERASRQLAECSPTDKKKNIGK